MFQFRFFVDPVDSGGHKNESHSDLGFLVMAGGTWQREIQIQLQTEILVFERLLGTGWLAEARKDLFHRNPATPSSRVKVASRVKVVESSESCQSSESCESSESCQSSESCRSERL